METTTSRTRASRNERTCCLDMRGADAQRARRLGPRQAFRVAYERLSLLAGVAPEPSIAVVAVGADARVFEALLLGDHRALLIGRHTQCGLRLPEETVALRQIAVLACFDGPQSILRLWDLRTESPFVVEDGQPSGAVVADGPLYAAIGSYALWFVPVGGAFRFVRGADAEAAWRALPPRTFLERRAPSARRDSPPSRILPDLCERSVSITRTVAPLLMGEGEEPEVGWGTLRLAGPERREKRTVSAEALEQGILVGRYERCGMLVGGPDRVSRVHVLLVRIGADVWAIDTASTHGVRRGEEIVRASVLGDADSLSLAGVVTLDWKRQQHPAA
jgi:hypothetical protein